MIFPREERICLRYMIYPRTISILSAFFLAALPVWADAAPPAASPRAQHEAHPEIQIRVQSFARDQVLINNPIRWSQFLFRVPEGTRVAKGDLLFEFDLSISEDRIQGTLRNLRETENRVEVQLKRIEERIIRLQDDKARLQDQLGVLQARLNFLKTLPRPEEVSVAQGRVEVAERNLAAAEQERDNLKNRLQQGLVAPAALEQAESALNIQQARTAYAKQRLATASLPAHPQDLRIVELNIANVALEIQHLDHEIASQQELLRIEQRSTDRQLEEIQRELDEVQTELQHAQVHAPADGVVLYSSRLKRELASGGKPALGMTLAEIPDPASLALRGRIPEDARSIFNVDDTVTVIMNPIPDQVLTGRVLSISPLPRDIADLDRRAAGSDMEETGVKVYDVVMLLDEIPPQLPFGVFGTATIRTQMPLNGPAVPLSWVRIRDGGHHVSINGRFQPVDGVPVGEWFVFENVDVPLERMQADGIWPSRDAESDLPDTDRVTASGQLHPLESVAVTVPPVRAWDMRVSELITEDAQVKKGDVLARLDSERIRNQVNDAQADVARRTGARESAAEQLTLRRREGEFRLARARNLLEIRRLENELVQAGISTSALHQALLDQRVAEIELESARRELARLERSPDMHAPTELRRARRNVLRREYQLESAQLQLELVQQGASPVERSRAELAVIRQEAELAQLESNTARGIRQAEGSLRWRTRQERNRTQRLERAQEDLASLVIRAPSDGLVKFENLWDGSATSKLRLGMSVYGRSQLMSLSDSSRMVIRVSVPERYVRHLEENLPVEVRIPSEGSRIWAGEVIHIAEVLEPADMPSLRGGLYANIEPPLEHVIAVEVLLRDSRQTDLKPGAVAHVVFPFRKERDSQ